MKWICLKKWFALILLTINISFVIFFYYQKNSLHVDELFSFGHANSSQGAFLTKGIDSNFNTQDLDKLLFNKWIDGYFFNNYITVQQEEKFKYKHIYENLKQGVHPPLFYILLHTICSFFPDTMSKWYGAMLNIPIYIVLLIMMYKLSLLFFNDKYLALLPVVFYAYSQIGFNTVIFIRMYTLQTLWAVSLLYEAMLMIKEKEVNKKRWFLIFLYSFLGMLTQYNSIIFSAILGCVLGVNLILQKRYKHLCIFAFVLLLSASFFIFSFPQVIYVMSHSSRSKELLKVFDAFYVYFFDDKKTIDIYMNSLWNFNKSYGNYLMLSIILTLFYKYKYTKESKDIDYMFIVVVLMMFYISVFMPQMWMYNMRYIMLIAPLISVVTIWYLAFILKFLPTEYIKIILSIIVFVNACFVDFSIRSPFAFQQDASIVSQLKNKNIVLSVDNSMKVFKLYTMIDVLKNAKKAYILQFESLANDKSLLKQLENSDYFIQTRGDYMTIYDVNYKLHKKIALTKELKNKVDFLNTVKIGEFFYDIYKVKSPQVRSEN